MKLDPMYHINKIAFIEVHGKEHERALVIMNFWDNSSISMFNMIYWYYSSKGTGNNTIPKANRTRAPVDDLQIDTY